MFDLSYSKNPPVGVDHCYSLASHDDTDAWLKYRIGSLKASRCMYGFVNMLSLVEFREVHPLSDDFACMKE